LLRVLVGFVVGAVAIYAIGMALAVAGVGALASLPYERMLLLMLVGGLGGAYIARLATGTPNR